LSEVRREIQTVKLEIIEGKFFKTEMFLECVCLLKCILSNCFNGDLLFVFDCLFQVLLTCHHRL